MSNKVGELTDQGIDFENYNLDEEIAKYQGDEPQGWQVLIRVYVPPKDMKYANSSLIMTSEISGEIDSKNKISNFVGLVVKMSKSAYQDERYNLTGPYCKVGDWVMFPRAHGHTYSYKGQTTITLNDDAILKVVNDPRDVTRLSV